ncbi:helix-turn-helix domain-containing protein [Actinoplanes sp. L3-i22]|uniref:helix-turn-helix domain-containing protein n=1 Tax=Actinoplanes sp. L3-i22 TaxID=2836373 RepID=UPI001C78FE84|nr:helix-turn-helix transcriptional regulator [Actinoplanes sp. L3-i22]BCY07542.1 transcriptional regulator [Actinoplanes sp. L3-i22]
MPLLRRVIGSVLRRVRQRQGRTLKEVATEAGVSLPYLSEVERGTKEASSEILAAICRALGLPMTDLLDLVRQELIVSQPVRPAGRFEVAQAHTPASPRAQARRGPTCSVSGRRPARVAAGGRPRTGLARMSARLFVTC